MQTTIVDTHVHIFPDEIVRDRSPFVQKDPAFALLYQDPASRMVTAATLMETMEADGVALSVVCGFPWSDPGTARMHNAYILEAAHGNPRKLVPLASVDPLVDEARAVAEQALSAGAAGLGEIGVYLRDPGKPEAAAALSRLCGLCAEAGKPMLLHTNEPLGHAYPGKSPMTLSGLYNLIRANPKTRFQLAHLGGGLFAYELMKKEVRETLLQCVFDTAAAPFLYRNDLYRVFVNICGTERLLYGSDYPLLKLDRYRKEVSRARLDPLAEEKLFSLNALSFWRVCGIEGR